jgi:hypothetical protein
MHLIKRYLVHFKELFPFQKAILLFFAFLLVSGKSWSVNYYSGGNNAPNLTISWWTNTNGTGAHPVNFTLGDAFFIQNGHTMTTTAVWNVSGAGNSITVQTGGTLVASNAVSATTWNFASGATYQHNQDGGTIPTATWNAASNCNGIVPGTLEIYICNPI